MRSLIFAIVNVIRVKSYLRSYLYIDDMSRQIVDIGVIFPKYN
jgi:hypothetical protein